MDFLSLGLVFGCVWAVKELGGFFKNPFGYKYKWQEFSENNKLDGYKVVKVNKRDNSVELIIDLPSNGTIQALEKSKGAIEKYFKSICEINDIRFSNLASIKLILSAIGKFDFEPVKALSNKLYVGRTFDNKNYFIDLAVDPHILICGKTGTGKSFLLALILTNLMYWNKNIDIYLNQTAKREVDYAKNCRQVKFVAYTPEETLSILKKAYVYIQERSKIMVEGGARDIDHYNKLYPKKKMKRKFYAFEEISSYRPQENDDEDTRKVKQQCWDLIEDCEKLGRSAGIHFIMVTQRATAKNLGGDGEIKSQICVCSFKMRSELDSRNAIDTDTAVKLEKQEVVISGNDGEVIVKTPFVDKEFTILQKYVPEIITAKTLKVKDKKVIRKEVEEVHFTHTPISNYKPIQSVELHNELVVDVSKEKPKIAKRGLYKC